MRYSMYFVNPSDSLHFSIFLLFGTTAHHLHRVASPLASLAKWGTVREVSERLAERKKSKHSNFFDVSLGVKKNKTVSETTGIVVIFILPGMLASFHNSC